MTSRVRYATEGKRKKRTTLSNIVVSKIIAALEENMTPPSSTLKEIAEVTGVSKRTVSRVKKEYGNGLYDRDGFRYPRSLLDHPRIEAPELS